jgi:hypothetical protein
MNLKIKLFIFPGSNNLPNNILKYYTRALNHPVYVCGNNVNTNITQYNLRMCTEQADTQEEASGVRCVYRSSILVTSKSSYSITSWF